MTNPLFRQVALTRLSSPDQLDQMVRVTSAREWLTLLSAVLVVVCFVVWGCLGTLPSKTQAAGVIVRAGKPVPIVAHEGGRIAQWAVKPGESIQSGQVVAILSVPAPVRRNPESSSPALHGLLGRYQENAPTRQEIESPFSGKVLELQAPPGSRVTAGATILTLSPDDAKDMELAVFVPAVKASEIKPGMSAEITPAFIAGGEYGFLRGKVRSVAESPLSDASLAAELQDSSIAQAVAARRPVIEVRVQLMEDHATLSGYQWSTPKGAPLKLAPDTPCTAQIVVREEPPIRLVIPAMKNWLEAF